MIVVRLFEGTSVEGEEHLHPHSIVRQTIAQLAVEKPLTGKRALDCSFAGGDGEESDGEKREFRSSVSKGSPRQTSSVERRSECVSDPSRPGCCSDPPQTADVVDQT